MPETLFVEVLLDQNLKKPLDYSVPFHLQKDVQVGMRVEVPLKNTLKKGTISQIKKQSSYQKLKPILRLLSSQSELSEPLWTLAEWMARYYAAPLQKVLKCFIPPSIRKGVKEQKRIFLQLAKTHAETLSHIEKLRTKSPAQADVLEKLLNSSKGLFLTDFSQKSAIQTLLRNKLISSKALTSNDDLTLEEDFFPTKPKELNPEQKKCCEEIQNSLRENAFSAHLIYGVTGSGKTEIYMQAIQTALDQNKSAIMLVPEISLTSQTIERFRARFSQKIAILHHRRSLGERNTSWEQLQKKEAMIVIGARSAVFAPAQNLGLIIVDEEHDSSYKQSEEAPCYHGRDVAVMRAHLEKCTVLLGSATPSIESRYNASINKYKLHTLSSRAGATSLASVKIVDMKREFDIAGGFTHFSSELIEAIKDRLKKGEQTLLFLNKRGYHRQQLCSSCRHVIKCPRCDLSLTFHRSSHLLHCHLCDHEQPSPRQCPSCGSAESLEFKGFGTEHVERSLHAIFPEIRTLRMDRDTTRKKTSHEDLFKQFRAHKADVLIGTQMIAKGFHFPSVTLVGVLNTDSTLSIPDFRSPEIAFQLLTQVAGRSGRSELPGAVIIQTFLPDHPTIRLAAAQDYPAFYASEIEERRAFGYPPFCHLVKLLFSAPDPETALSAAESSRAALLPHLPEKSEALPVVPAGHSKVKDLYRFQFIIKILRISDLYHPLKALPPSPASLKIDVDPLSTFF